MCGTLLRDDYQPDGEMKWSLPSADGSASAPAPGRLKSAEASEQSEDPELGSSLPEDDHGSEAASISSFEDELTAALDAAFPILLVRLEQSLFADWHRRMGLMLDLAQGASLAVLSHCRKHRHIPSELVGYLVQSARHLAIAAWKERRDGPVNFADLERVQGKQRDAGRIRPVDEGTDQESDTEQDVEEGATEFGVDDEEVNWERPGSDYDDDVIHQEEVSPEALIQQEEDDVPRSTVNRTQLAVDNLPRRQREALELYMQFKDDNTFQEMGEMMGITADGFEKNLERAMKTLRKVLRAE
jgi:RNA polymerase sigma factor (sigma-70 family)